MLKRVMQSRKDALLVAKKEAAILKRFQEFDDGLKNSELIASESARIQEPIALLKKLGAVILPEVQGTSNWEMFCLIELLQRALQFPEGTVLQNIHRKFCEIFSCEDTGQPSESQLNLSIWLGYGKPELPLQYYWQRFENLLWESDISGFLTEDLDTPIPDGVGVLELTLENIATDADVKAWEAAGGNVVPITQRQDASAAG